MVLENIPTSRLTNHGIQSKIELPLGQRHMASCNQAVRSGFSEPLALVEHNSEHGCTAVERAVQQHTLTKQYIADKETKLALFQAKVQSRLREMKKMEKQVKVNDTIHLQATEDILMKSLDPTRKPPLISSPNIAIHSQVLSSKPGVSQTEELLRFNKYARSKLAGDKQTEGIIKIPCMDAADSESDKENSTPDHMTSPDPAQITNKGTSQPSTSVSQKPSTADHNIRIHRLVESRRAYSLLERERIKEGQKSRDHRRNVERLREETVRIQTEKHVNEAISKYKAQSPVKEVKIEERIHKTVVRNKKISSQTDRLIKRLRSKISTMPSPPPALCPCDTDILQTGPGLCAQNCVFYDNNRAFAQSLSSLMACYRIT